MFVKTITYTDYDGVERTEKYMFNLTQAELVKMNFSDYGKMDEILQDIIDSKDAKRIMERTEDLIDRSYGVKSEDGRRFIKNAEVLAEFKQSPAYDKFFMELATDAKACADFVNNIMPELPKDLADKTAPVTQLNAAPNT